MEARAGGPGEASLENKAVAKNRNEKFIRLITVIAYFCSVSGAAVMLSLYYIFLWDPDRRSNHAAFQEPAPSLRSHLPSLSTSASPLLRHIIGDHTVVNGDCLCNMMELKSANSAIIMPGENNRVKRGPGYESNSKSTRLFTVMAYICSVSIAAALLSLYYFFIWNPTTYENSLLSITTVNTSYLSGLSHPAVKSSSINATSPLLRPLLGNCSGTSDAQGNLTSHLMQDKTSAAF